MKKKAKKNFFKFYEPTFKANTALFIGSYEEFCKKFSLNQEDQEYYKGADGTVIKATKTHKDGSEETLRVIWVRDFNDSPYRIGILVHELYHLAVGIMEDKGIPVNTDNEEIPCYLAEEFFNHYYGKLRG